MKHQHILQEATLQGDFYQSKTNLHHAISDAYAKGYILDFQRNKLGSFDCHFQVVYDPSIIQTYVCPTARAFVHLIAGKNGKGTCIEYWNHN